MRILRQFTFPFLIGILLLVLAACGSSATATPSSQATADPTATGTGATVGEGESFEFQLAWITRTVDAFRLSEEWADRIRDRSNGRLDITLVSYPELGIAGPDTLRLMEDGTL